MTVDCWLPQMEPWDGDAGSWVSYQDKLYNIFANDFINSHPNFEGKRVVIRREPIEYGREEAFYHVTCQDYSKGGNRVPDMRRCERIRWVRAFLENYDKCNPASCENCTGIKLWRKPYQNRERVHILLEEERYLVVVEPRETYCLLITAFFLDYDHSLAKKLKEYEQYRKN